MTKQESHTKFKQSKGLEGEIGAGSQTKELKRKTKVPPYLKYLLLREKGWCLQAVRTAGHTLVFTSKPLLVS